MFYGKPQPSLKNTSRKVADTDLYCVTKSLKSKFQWVVMKL